MSIQTLIKIAPPPGVPVAAGTPELWPVIEEGLGTALPADYKEFINLYGAGDFFGFLSLVSPFALDGSVPPDSLLYRWAEAGARNYAGMKEHFGGIAPEKFPFTAFPERNGLLAMGGYEYGGTIYWLTEGLPDTWGIVAYDEEFFEFRSYPITVTGFLVEWINGTLKPEFFDEGNYQRNPPIFRPL